MGLCKNPVLVGCVDELYRETGRFYDGGTASGLFYEAETGVPLSPYFHIFKARHFHGFLMSFLRRTPKLTPEGFVVAASIIRDLEIAIEAFERLRLS